MEEHVASINKTAFICPHCGAYTSQQWYSLYAKELDKERPLPLFPDEEAKQRIKSNREIQDEVKDNLIAWINKIDSRLVKFNHENESCYSRESVINLHISECYNCHEISVWEYDKLVFPEMKIDIKPNKDLPAEIKLDFEEAREIVNSSPRGAAALLRLSIQKLCKYLGEKGVSIDEDIGNLVKKGLNPLVQKSLDIVRVIGNEAVHPGTINLNDDRQTSITLFELVNSITEQMISHPNTVKKLYEKLPEKKRKAIERRDLK